MLGFSQEVLDQRREPPILFVSLAIAPLGQTVRKISPGWNINDEGHQLGTLRVDHSLSFSVTREVSAIWPIVPLAVAVGRVAAEND